MATSEETCENNPNFAIICSFLIKFGHECGVQATIPNLKHMLEDTKNISEELKEIHIHLLRKGKKRVNKEKWEKSLIKFCHEYSSIDAWELERFGYKKAKLSVKIEILKRLLELQFDSNAKFKADVNKHDAKTLRVLPIGKDIEGQMYWYQLDNDCNIRLYKLDAEDEDSWELLCSTKEELYDVIDNLGSRSVKKRDLFRRTKDEVPENMDTDIAVDKEKVRESGTRHEDLKATISLTNPCAIIIKSEKRDSGQCISNECAKKENTSEDNTADQVSKSHSVSKNDSLECDEHNTRTLKADLCVFTVNVPTSSSETISEINLKRSTVNENSQSVCSDLSTSKVEEKDNTSNCLEDSKPENRDLSILKTEKASSENQKFQNSLRLKRTELSEMQSDGQQNTTFDEMCKVNDKTDSRQIGSTTYEETSKSATEETSQTKDLNSGKSILDNISDYVETKFKGSKIKLYEKWSNEKKLAQQIAAKESLENKRSVDLSSKKSELPTSASSCVDNNDKESQNQNSRSSVISQSSVIQCPVVHIKSDAEDSVLVKSQTSVILPKKCEVDVSVDNSSSTSQVAGVSNLAKSPTSVISSNKSELTTSVGERSSTSPVEKCQAVSNSNKILHSAESILARPFKKKHLFLYEEQSKEMSELNRHSVICKVKSSNLNDISNENVISTNDMASKPEISISLSNQEATIMTSSISNNDCNSDPVLQLQEESMKMDCSEEVQSTLSVCDSKNELSEDVNKQTYSSKAYSNDTDIVTSNIDITPRFGKNSCHSVKECISKTSKSVDEHSSTSWPLKNKSEDTQQCVVKDAVINDLAETVHNFTDEIVNSVCKNLMQDQVPFEVKDDNTLISSSKENSNTVQPELEDLRNKTSDVLQNKDEKVNSSSLCEKTLEPIATIAAAETLGDNDQPTIAEGQTCISTETPVDADNRDLVNDAKVEVFGNTLNQAHTSVMITSSVESDAHKISSMKEGEAYSEKRELIAVEKETVSIEVDSLIRNIIDKTCSTVNKCCDKNETNVVLNSESPVECNSVVEDTEIIKKKHNALEILPKNKKMVDPLTSKEISESTLTRAADCTDSGNNDKTQNEISKVLNVSEVPCSASIIIPDQKENAEQVQDCIAHDKCLNFSAPQQNSDLHLKKGIEEKNLSVCSKPEPVKPESFASVAEDPKTTECSSCEIKMCKDIEKSESCEVKDVNKINDTKIESADLKSCKSSKDIPVLEGSANDDQVTDATTKKSLASPNSALTLDDSNKSDVKPEPTKLSFALDFFDEAETFKDILNKKFPFLGKPHTEEAVPEESDEEPEDELSPIYRMSSTSLCAETKGLFKMGKLCLNNRSFKIKYCKRLNLKIESLEKSELCDRSSSIGRRTSGRTRNTLIDLTPPVVRKRGGRKPKIQTSPKDVKEAETLISKSAADFTLPEGFLEILDGNANAEKPSESPVKPGGKRGRIGRPSKASSVVVSSESESTLSLPIKRSRRIQEQHQKKMSELAVEMQKEHCRLEQLAKKNTTKTGKSPAKSKTTPRKKASEDYIPPEDFDDTCSEPKSGRRKRRGRVNIAKMALMYDDESKESEQSTSRSTEKSRRRRKRGKKTGYKPWDVSSESTTSVEEVTEEEQEEEEEEEQLIFNANEDEFACEDLEDDDEPVVVRRARTAKKIEETDGIESIVDDKPCCKCGKPDHPELILLCDECDDGYHTGCLIPPLIHIPHGDWYCQPCEHVFLYECLRKELQKLEQMLKQKEREELRKQRLAYVGISLDNVLKPEKKESSSGSEEMPVEPVKAEKVLKYHQEHSHKKDYGKRSVRSRQKVNYRFKEYDEIMATAIGDDFAEPKLPEDVHQEAAAEEPEEKKENSDNNDDDFYLDSSPVKRKRVRKLNDLDFSDEDDSGDDYKGLSTDTEHTPNGNSNNSQSESDAASGEWRIVKTKIHRKPRKKRGDRYHSSEEEEEEDYDSDASSYRPTTRRAAQKSISYREISSEEEWEEKKQTKKRKKKDSSSEASSEASFMSGKGKKKTKWGSSSSASEENSEESEDSRSSRESGSQWKISKTIDSSRIKLNINKKIIDSDDESSKGSDRKSSKPKVRLNHVISDDSEEEEDSSESSKESGSESEASKQSDSNKSDSKNHKSKQPPVKGKEDKEEVTASQKKPATKTSTSKKPAAFKNGCSMKITFSQDKPSQPSTPIVKTAVKVATIPAGVANLAKNVTVCRAIAVNREKIATNQIVVQTVVVKTVPKGVIKEIKMVPSKIQYKDKSDTSETESRKVVEPTKEAPISSSPVAQEMSLPTIKTPATSQQTHKNVSRGPPIPQSRPHNPGPTALDPRVAGNLSPQHMPVKPPTIPPRPFSSVIERHPMHQMLPKNQHQFQGAVQQSGPVSHPMQQPMSTKMRQARPTSVIETQNNNMMQLGMHSKNIPPPQSYPSATVESPGRGISPHQQHPVPGHKSIPPTRAFTSTIVEPFSTADVDQGSDSRDEVPLERIPGESENSNAAYPQKNIQFEKDHEYRPAKEVTNFAYNMTEEKSFPSSYSPLSSLQEFTSRPSPLKPSLVGTFSGNSSPTRLTPLDSYSQTNSPKGFISLDSYPQPRKKIFYNNPPHEGEPLPPRHGPPGSVYPGEGRFEQEPYQCAPSPAGFQSPSVQQREVGTPPRLYSQFPDSYAPPRSPEYYHNQQQPYYPPEEGASRPGYQPNYAPGDHAPPYPYMPNPMQQSNDGFMIDTILRARNEEEDISNVSGIVQYITQQ